MKPLIGITSSYDRKDSRFVLPEAYVDAVLGAGGYPVILPVSGNIKEVDFYIKKVKGVIFSGGIDVDPLLFGEEPQPGLGEINPERDRFEMMLIKAALEAKRAILGICRGIQILNIACGGTVLQHIPGNIEKPLKHSQSAPKWHPTHTVSVAEGTLLGKIIGTGKTLVNSFHHQAVKKVADGFKISAVSCDGVIEAIENPGYRFVMGVQWHPECMYTHDEKTRKLFEAFVNSCYSSEKYEKIIK